MEYIYAALLLHKLDKEITEDSVSKIIEASGIKPDEVKEKLDGAQAVHDFAGFRKGLEKNGVSEEEIEVFNNITFPCFFI